jgi:hypothetical protein
VILRRGSAVGLLLVFLGLAAAWFAVARSDCSSVTVKIADIYDLEARFREQQAKWLPL